MEPRPSRPHLRFKPMLLVTAIVLLVSGACLLWVDQPLARYMESVESQTDPIAQPITMLGKAEWPLSVTAVLTLIACMMRRWRLANRSALVFFSITATLVVHPLKVAFGRTRPKLYFAEESIYGFYPFKFFEQFDDYYDYASYPSGHSAVAGALAMSVWLVAPNGLRYPVAVIAVSIAVSRFVVGSHWVADTLAGFMLGVVCAAVLHWRFTRRRWLDHPAGLFRAGKIDA